MSDARSHDARRAYLCRRQPARLQRPREQAAREGTSDTAAGEVSAIRSDAAYLVGASEANAGSDALDFGGHTGARHVNCAIVLDGTKVTSRDVAGGVVMEVTARDLAHGAEVRRLAREQDERRALRRAMDREPFKLER